MTDPDPTPETAHALGRADAREETNRANGEMPEAYLGRLARLLAGDGDDGTGHAGEDADALIRSGEMGADDRDAYLGARRTDAACRARAILNP